MIADEKTLMAARDKLALLRQELNKRIVGHGDLVNGILAALLASGHVLLEGVPGLGKTLLVKTLADAIDLDFARIQFTPDLMPADIIGTQMVAHDDEGRRYFQFEPGPVFTQLLLADEINRATPKTQSALLEAMEEKHVTVGRAAHALEEPFMVLATQNPIEMEGTYPLPEAQLDRFMLKLMAEYPNADELSRIVDRTTGTEVTPMQKVMTADELLELRRYTRQIVIAEHVKDYAVQVILATHSSSATAPPAVRQFVRYGASPRGAQSMILIAKAFALFDARLNVGFEDLQNAAIACLRHRLLLNFEGEAEGIGVDAIIREVLEHIPTAASVS